MTESEKEILAGIERLVAERKIHLGLLAEASIHVYSSADAEHMLDGFKPQKRPIDDLVGRIKTILEGSE